jgi:hypothetical protein
MSDFQADLAAAPMGFAGLTALIGNRLYPNSSPADAVCPFVIMYEFATPREATFRDPAAISKPRVQYSIYAKGYGAAKDVADQLRLALAATPWPIVLEDERGNRDATSGINRRDLDVRITHVGA